MKVCLWRNSTKSGIGDRLQDILLVLSYSRYHKCDKLIIEWKTIKQTTCSKRPKYRDNDQKLEVILKYISFPHDIIFNMINYNSIIHFKDYLGGIYSKKSFCDKYNLSLDKFILIYDQVVKDFSYISNIYFDKIDSYDNILAIHLRRSDKIHDNNKSAKNALGIEQKHLNELNRKTEDTINIMLQKGYKNILFVSDDENEKKRYIELYKNKCNIIDVKGNLESGEQTYIDLYSLIKADTIIMSQKWSNFSAIASILGSKKLIYFDKTYINKYNYNSEGYKYFLELE